MKRPSQAHSELGRFLSGIKNRGEVVKNFHSSAVAALWKVKCPTREGRS